jgi:hypothetical protein
MRFGILGAGMVGVSMTAHLDVQVLSTSIVIADLGLIEIPDGLHKAYKCLPLKT